MADAHPNIRQRDGIWRRVGEAALKRPWVTLGACLVLLVALAWLYLAIMAEAMAAMDSALHSSRAMWLMPMGEWGAREFALGLAMWAVMMVGMMVPPPAHQSLG